MEYRLYATCPDETTEFLADEIRELGATDVKIGYRVVYFNTDEKTYYKAHLHLRLASRVFRIIRDIPASSPTIIYDKTKRIKFHELFRAQEPLRIQVTTSSKESKIPGHLIGSKIREAVTDSFKHFAQESANLSSRDANIGLTGFQYNNRLMISVDTSLKSLHKRGYRIDGHPAPIKETLASTLLRACKYDGTKPLLDPMCGSGTIAIEGAQIAINKQPLIHRKKGEFGFEYLKDFNSKLWRQVQDEARLAQREPQQKIWASDISLEHVDLAQKAALSARVEKYIGFSQQDFYQLEKPAESGLLITNMPYGLRLNDSDIDKAERAAF